MGELLLFLAVLSLVFGLIGLGWSVREIYRARFYKPPKRKRRSTYVGR